MIFKVSRVKHCQEKIKLKVGKEREVKLTCIDIYYMPCINSAITFLSVNCTYSCGF